MTQAGPDPSGQVAAPELVQFELAIVSRLGGRAVNEDACGHWHQGSHLCCVMADGAGGHGGGDVASRLVVGHLIDGFARAPELSRGGLFELLLDAGHHVREHRADAVAQREMHSTVVALFVDVETQHAMWAHVGDSRLYVFRQGGLATRTRDHSTVQLLVDQGLLDEARTRSHPQRSELLCALGSEDEDLQVSVSLEPWAITPGDVFLLCTDGLWEFVEDEALAESLRAADGPQAWLLALETMVLAQAIDKPRHDNYSAITLWARQVPG